MPRTIGDVSPTIAAALIRRGEQNLGTKFTRGPTTRTTEGTQNQAALKLAIARDERAQEAADRREARDSRNEGRIDRGFEFSQEEAGKNRIEREGKAEREGRKLTIAERKGQGETRKQGQNILDRMASILRRARVPNRDTGRPDPTTVEESRTLAAALWQQFLALDLPEEEMAAAREQMRQFLPSTPASRAPGNTPRRDPGQATTPGSAGRLSRGVLIDDTLRSGIGLPTRTP